MKIKDLLSLQYEPQSGYEGKYQKALAYKDLKFQQKQLNMKLLPKEIQQRLKERVDLKVIQIMKSHNVQNLNTFENTYSQSHFKDLEQTLQLQLDQKQKQNQNVPFYYSRINTPISQQGIRKRIRKTSNQLDQQQEEFQEEFLDQWKNKNGKFLFGGLQLENTQQNQINQNHVIRESKSSQIQLRKLTNERIKTPNQFFQSQNSIYKINSKTGNNFFPSRDSSKKYSAISQMNNKEGNNLRMTSGKSTKSIQNYLKNIKQEVEELITDKKEMNKLKKIQKNFIQSKQQTRFNSQEKNEKQYNQLKESKSQKCFNPSDYQKNDFENNDQNDIFCNEKSQWVVNNTNQFQKNQQQKLSQQKFYKQNINKNLKEQNKQDINTIQNQEQQDQKILNNKPNTALTTFGRKKGQRNIINQSIIKYKDQKFNGKNCNDNDKIQVNPGIQIWEKDKIKQNYLIEQNALIQRNIQTEQKKRRIVKEKYHNLKQVQQKNKQKNIQEQYEQNEWDDLFETSNEFDNQDFQWLNQQQKQKKENLKDCKENEQSNKNNFSIYNFGQTGNYQDQLNHKMDNMYCISNLKPQQFKIMENQREKFLTCYSEIQEKLNQMAEMKINKQDFYGENIDIVKNIKYQTLDQTKNINKDLKSWYDSIKNIPEKPLDGRALVLMTEKQKKQYEKNQQIVNKQLEVFTDQYLQLQKFTFDRKLAQQYENIVNLVNENQNEHIQIQNKNQSSQKQLDTKENQISIEQKQKQEVIKDSKFIIDDLEIQDIKQQDFNYDSINMEKNQQNNDNQVHQKDINSLQEFSISSIQNLEEFQNDQKVSGSQQDYEISQKQIIQAKQIKLISQQDNIILQKKKFDSIRKALIKQLNSYKQLKLTVRQVIEHQLFIQIPYFRQNSKQFFQVIKENNYQSVEKMLDKCRYHVYDIDFCEETALHWAAKRGLQKIVDLLLQYNCDVNARDHLGRTPLYYSLRSGHSQIAIQLLRHRAVPWTYNSNYKYDNLIFGPNNKVSQECRLIFRTSQKINFLAYLTPTHKQEKLWEDSQHLFEQDLEAFKRGELKIQSYF